MSDKIVSIASSKSIPVLSEAHPKFKIGDVVQLQSGGLPMTVRKVMRSSVQCDWQPESGELCTADFAPPMLLLCPPNEEIEVDVALDESDMA